MPIESGFEIRVAVLHDTGPSLRVSDAKMAHRIDDVKSLVYRGNFPDDFTVPQRVKGRRSCAPRGRD